MEYSSNQKRIKDRGGMRSAWSPATLAGPMQIVQPKPALGGFDRRADLGQQRDPVKGAVERRDAFRKSE